MPDAESSARTRARVAMLVNNPCTNDSRVIKEAEALARCGYAVTVVCRHAGGLPREEIVNGVSYRRVEPVPLDWPLLRQRLVASLSRGTPRNILPPPQVEGPEPLDTVPQRTASNEAPRHPGASRQAGKTLNLSPLASETPGHSDAQETPASSRAIVPVSGVRTHRSRLSWALSRRVLRRLWVRARGSVVVRRGRGLVLVPGKRAFRTARRAYIIKVKPGLRRVRHLAIAPGRHLLKQGRRFYVLGLKPPLRRIRRFAIMRGKPLLRKCRRAYVLRLKPILRKPYRLYLLRIKPRLRALRRAATGRIHRPLRTFRRASARRGKVALRYAYWFSEADEFGTAATRFVERLDPDIVHAHDLATLPAAGRIAETRGAKLVYDSHELEMHRNATYPRAVWWRRRYLERKYIRRTDAVVTVSESIADHLKSDYAIPRPRVIMNAPVFDDAAVHPANIRDDLDLARDVPLAVYVGSVTINRGIERTVRALAHDPEMHFATVGPRRKATEDAVVETAEALGVRGRLHLVDPVRPEEVVGYIRSADVSVLAIQNVCLSYDYCMPNKLLESTFAAIPVAVANLLEMRRFVERFGCGLVMDETDPADIARTLRELVDNRARYILPLETRAEIALVYGWSAQAAKLCSLYDSLLHSEPLAVRDAA